MRQSRPQVELYEDFLHQVETLNRRDRTVTNRRMLSVFVWCFFAPIAVSVLLTALSKVKLVGDPRGYLEWLILVFPVAYSAYILGLEVIRDLPHVFRRGALANVVRTAAREGHWRDEVCQNLRAQINATTEDWHYIYDNFRMEISALHARTGYLTVLAGAVFFLILEGIDVLGPGESPQHVSPQAVYWVFSSVLP